MDDHGFAKEDFAHTANVIRSGSEARARAILSNNRNIILAALDMAAKADARRGAVACKHCGGTGIEHEWGAMMP